MNTPEPTRPRSDHVKHLLAITLSLAGPIAAQAIPVRAWVVAGDPMPGSGGVVQNVGMPTVRDGSIAWTAVDLQSYQAVLRAPVGGGPTVVVADDTMTMPNSTTVFWQLGAPMPRGSNGDTLFYGRDRVLLTEGLYLGDGTRIQVVADRAGGVYSAFASGSAAIDNQDVAFVAANPATGLFVTTVGAATSTVVARGGDPVPGDPTGTIAGLEPPSLQNGVLVFTATCRDTVTFQRFYAVLRYDLASGVLSTAVGRNTQVPGIGGTFSLIRPATTDGTSIVFAADQGNPLFGGWSGLCRLDASGALTALATNASRLPGSTQPPPVFGGALSGWRALGDAVVFSAGDGVNGQTMLYAIWRGRTVRLAERGDALPGGTLDDLWFSPLGFDGRFVAFRGGHGTGTAGAIYTVDLACANVESYGAGCAPTGPPPELEALSCPAAGESFSLGTRGHLGPFALLVFGTTRTRAPLLGCEVLVGNLDPGTALVPLVGGTGRLDAGAIPAALSGLSFTAQALSVAPTAGGLASSNGLEIAIY